MDVSMRWALHGSAGFGGFDAGRYVGLPWLIESNFATPAGVSFLYLAYREGRREVQSRGRGDPGKVEG
jgi:hypothetical protein